MSQVIVVGGGLSGVSAANTVLEHGGNVLLLDKMPFCGGNSTKATSGINAALSRTQIQQKIPDSVEIFEKDTALSATQGKEAKSTDLIKVMVGESASAVDWLQQKFKLDLSLLSQLGGHQFKRTHRGKEKFPGMTITYALIEGVEKAAKETPERCRIITKARVIRLLTGEGRVTGVVYEKDGKNFEEYGSVIICTGGYAHDYGEDSLLKKYRPELMKFPTTNGPYCTGDGIKMSVAIGAETADMEWVQVHPTGLVHPEEPDAKVKFLAAEALRGVGGIMLDANGNRFCDELGRRDYVSETMFKNKAPFRLILNSKSAAEIEWHCKHYVGRGLMKELTGQQMAQEMGVPLSKIEQTFADYNRCGQQNKCPFGRKFFANMPWDINDKFHVSIITPVVHYCMGGLKMTAGSQVVGTNGQPVQGLWAAGEVMGGVHGKNRLGGNSLLDCVVFGRVAGRNASAYTMQNLITAAVQNPQAFKLQTGPGQRLETLEKQMSASKVAGGSGKKTFSAQEVAKHSTKDDCWVIIDNKVYDVTSFLNDHPGGAKAILLYAGKDATEQFDMLHDRNVIEKYAPDTYIGDIGAGGSQCQTQTCSVNKQEALVASNQESFLSGGTADILPNERKKATFDVKKMHSVLVGGDKAAARRKFIFSPVKDNLWHPFEMDRHEIFSEAVDEFIKIHKEYAEKGFVPTRADMLFMGEASQKGGSLSNHYYIFVPTIANLGTEEQVKYWLPKAMRFQIIGNYCQTEFGHGSNVRGLSAIAEYDKNTQEFVLNTPTLRSIKWWPGALGKTSTHAALYAQLIIDGKECGLHVFMIQIRDENHKPLPGIELGDLGTKMGDHANDTGYMILKNIRIPREFMLAKHSQVTPEGKYVVNKEIDPRVHYATMMYTRAQLIGSASNILARCVTIATRYNAVRYQGFVKNSAKSYKSPELPLIDYKSQQYRIFKQIALSYAFRFTSLWMIEHVKRFEGDKATGVVKQSQGLQEVAVTSGGLKALNTFEALEASEDLRKCCGGNGYLLHSGIGALVPTFAWVVTAEGDYIVMLLLLARYLLKCAQTLSKGKKLADIVSYLNDLADPKYDPTKTPPITVQNLMSPDFQLTLFKMRAQYHVVQAVKAVMGYSKKGQNADQAWISGQRYLLQAARSHAWYTNMVAFHQYCNQTTDVACKDQLSKLLALFGCSNIIDDHWQGVIDQSSYITIHQAIDQLLDDIRPNAVSLVDAFDIPDNFLMSSIGAYDGNVYERLLSAARKSNLNQVDPFKGYEQVLKPHLDHEFLKHHNKLVSRL